MSRPSLPPDSWAEAARFWNRLSQANGCRRSITLDLREAELAPEGATLEVLAGFGGVGILVPPNWRVNLSGMPLFGGLDNKVRNGHPAPDAPTLDVQATALFGGVEVKP